MAGVTTTIPAEATEDSGAVDPSPVQPSRWERIGLVVLLVATAVMYLWNITVNGMANQFYAGAAAAGSKNWEALLFGSLDSENFITVDKPPVSQWVMGLSGQLFGFSSASMLVPEALMAVATVWLLYAAVARICGPRAGLLAGAALALTPVAALMFRFNNPDAAMVLLMMASAYCTVRALERASGKWLAWAGVALGFAFLAKMLEGLMIAPAIGLAYLIAAPTTLRRRALHLLGATAAFVVSAGWFVVLTLVWPASSRPYIAGSTDDNFMNLVLGYNGFARVLGRNHQSFGPGDPLGNSVGNGLRHAGGFGGMGNQKEGLSRLFTGEFGFEIGWLIPAALLGLVLVLIARGRAPRTDRVRVGVLLFGGWLVIDGLVLSYMKGMVHPYYCLSLAPAVAGTVAIAAHEMWVRRRSWFGRMGVTALIAVTGIWSWVVLGRNDDWIPALRWTILVGAVVAAIVIAVSASRRVAVAAAVLGVVAVLAGPTAYAVATLGVPHRGGGPTVGPSRPKTGSEAGFGESKDNLKLDDLLRATTTKWSAAISGSSAAAGLELSTGTAVMAIGGFTGSDPAPSLGQFKADVSAGQIAYYIVEKDWRGRPGGWPGTSRNHSGITDWVTATFPVTQVGDADVYDLSRPK